MKNKKILNFTYIECNNPFSRTEKLAKASTKNGSDNKYCTIKCERQSRKTGKIEKCLICNQ